MIVNVRKIGKHNQTTLSNKMRLDWEDGVNAFTQSYDINDEEMGNESEITSNQVKLLLKQIKEGKKEITPGDVLPKPKSHYTICEYLSIYYSYVYSINLH